MHKVLTSVNTQGRSVVLLVLLAVVVLWQVAVSDDSYYHSLFSRHALQKSNKYISVQFPTSDVAARITELLASYPCLDPTVEPNQYASTFVLFRLAQGCDYGSVAGSLNSDSLTVGEAPTYLTFDSGSDAEHFRIADEIILAFDYALPSTTIAAILEAHNLTVREANTHNPNQFLCAIGPGDTMNAVAKGNKLHGLAEVRWACANFYSQTVLAAVPTDDYYPQEYYLRNIQADSAQLVANPSADDIKVAVIDDGLAEHIDFPESRVYPGWDAAGDNHKVPIPDNDVTPK